MFKDLKEYQEITRIYNESVNISEEQRAINKIFIEEDFTLEEIEYLEENFDELWENELAALTEDYVAESLGQENLNEEQINEVLGLVTGAKLAMKANKGLTKLAKKAAPAIKKGLGAAKTAVKDTARGAVSVGKSALKKVGGALKKAAPFAAKVALPFGAGAGLVGGINALRKRGKNERLKAEAEKKKNDAIDKQVDKYVQDRKGPINKDLTIDKSKDKKTPPTETKGGEKAGEAGAEALKDKKTETKTKPMSKIEFQNRKRFGNDAINKKKEMNAAFQKTKDKNSGYTKQQFIKDYPKSQTAKKYYQSDKAYRDYKKGLKKEEIERLDAYDMVLEYLFATEQASTIEEANYIMTEMDYQTIGEIVKQVKVALSEDV